MKNRLGLCCTVLLTATALSGCGYLPGTGGDTSTVTVWLMKGSASDGFIHDFTQQFESEHKDIKLDVRIQEWGGIGAKVTAALQSGDGPDLIEVGNTQVAMYAQSGGLRDLTLEAVRDLGSKDWLPGLADPGSINGAQFGIPWYAANRVVIYNKDLFKDAGITKPPRTRAEWIHDTGLLNQGGRQGIYLAGQDWYTLSGFIWDEGGELAEEAGGNYTGVLDSPAALRAMSFYKELQSLGDGPRNADEAHPQQADVFAGGDVAQIVAVPGTAQTILKKNPELKGKLGFFPIPGKTAARPAAVFTGGSDLIIPDKAHDGDAAVKVVEALAGKKWQTELARTMSYVPNKAGLAGVVQGEEGTAAMAAGAAHGRATPNSPRWAAVEADNPIKPYMTEVLTGQDPEAAAKKASKRLTDELVDR
ncbi:extracellular solute-binding protein [Streptomyces sp. NBC_01267]|uniref:extracellular solute-binding protein n=1 Tax=unclassified Streptomyces TaxID=2593676 RepID=UPI0022523CE7|nr:MULTISPECIES: extracellular solute-binding protein [unclassified Streptomyces]MCX4553556.1 extracellular solute-binding protein [Streptomyces sp. NBC_01500]